MMFHPKSKTRSKTALPRLQIVPRMGYEDCSKLLVYTLSIRRSWVFIDATQVKSFGCLIPVEDANIRDSGAKATACGRLASLAAASGKGKVNFTDQHLYHQMSCPKSFEMLNKHHSAATRVIYIYI